MFVRHIGWVRKVGPCEPLSISARLLQLVGTGGSLGKLGLGLGVRVGVGVGARSRRSSSSSGCYCRFEAG